MLYLMKFWQKFIPTKPLYQKNQRVKHANYGGVGFFVTRRIWCLTWYYNVINYGYNSRLHMVPEARLRKWE